MPCTGHDFLFDETVLDPQSETRMATIFLYKRAPDEFFRHAHSPRAEGVATHAWEGGRRRVWVVRWRPSEKGDGDRTP